jgi:hypothetical protein
VRPERESDDTHTIITIINDHKTKKKSINNNNTYTAIKMVTDTTLAMWQASLKTRTVSNARRLKNRPDSQIKIFTPFIW